MTKTAAPQEANRVDGWDGEISAMLAITVVPTAAGHVGLAFSPWGLVSLRFPQPSPEIAWAELDHDYPGAQREPDQGQAVAVQLARYFDGETTCFEVDRDVARYTPFQRNVWQAATAIPYGETRSYAWIAQQADAPNAFRAVGSALRINPIPIIVPCHRVLRSDGSLGGYRGGQTMKQRLLAMEKGLAASQVKELWQAAT